MKYVTYRPLPQASERRGPEGNERVGLLLAGGVAEVNGLLARAKHPPVGSMTELIRRLAAGDLPAALLRHPPEDLPVQPMRAVQLLAPIPRPARNIFCLGKNYAAHAAEVKLSRLSGKGLPEYPIYFTKTADPAVPDGGTVRFSRRVTGRVDYEAELAVVIGREGRDIDPARAREYIFGYTILNDISARDLQARHEQWFKGKNLDTFCPMGPCIAGAEEIPFPPALGIRCRVNGELRQSDNTSRLLFGLPAILADLSRGLTLRPGDIISTGTPAGVGAGFDPPRFLKDGDVVECEIDRIGVLRNIICETDP